MYYNGTCTVEVISYQQLKWKECQWLSETTWRSLGPWIIKNLRGGGCDSPSHRLYMYWVTMDNTSPMTQFMRVNVHVCYSFALHTLLSELR